MCWKFFVNKILYRGSYVFYTKYMIHIHYYNTFYYLLKEQQDYVNSRPIHSSRARNVSFSFNKFSFEGFKTV